LKLHSIKLRLMALSTIWVIGSLAASAIVLQYLFVSSLERDVRQDLEAALTRIVALLDEDAPQIGLSSPLPDPRYDTPLGGRYWQIEVPESQVLLRSRSLWDMVLPVTSDEARVGHFEHEDKWHIIYVARTIAIGEKTVRLTVGEDHRPIHEAARLFLWDTVRLFALLGALILVAAWFQLRLGLAPLDKLRSAVDAVRQGRSPRLIGRFPTEVRPLANEVSALLDERDANLERARQRASDLAHGLKTPLAALHGIAIRVRDKGNGRDADLIDDLAFEMSKRVDYQMRLATLRLRSSEHRESASLNNAVLRTIAVLKKTGRGEALHWLADLPQDHQVDIHRQDLMELVGITLENAAKWASTRITVRSMVLKAHATIEISDDGPGIPEERLSQLGERGQRLDEATPGNGLGLAIASEILALNKGRIDFRRGETGGLVVALTLPLAPR
jgi:signal transduction histidine kinase